MRSAEIFCTELPAFIQTQKSAHRSHTLAVKLRVWVSIWGVAGQTRLFFADAAFPAEGVADKATKRRK